MVSAFMASSMCRLGALIVLPCGMRVQAARKDAVISVGSCIVVVVAFGGEKLSKGVNCVGDCEHVFLGGIVEIEFIEFASTYQRKQKQGVLLIKQSNM